MLRTTALATALALFAGLSASDAKAQFVTYYSPIVAPAPIVAAPIPTVVARPVVAVGAGPVAVSVARPVATVAYSPVAVAPIPTVVASPVVTSVPVYRTRWRPLLGGTVTTVRYRPVVTGAYYAY